MNKNAYIFTGEKYMIKRGVEKLKASLGIEYPEMNITEFKTMPKTLDIIEACDCVPFLSPKRLVIISECGVLTSKGSAEEAKKILSYIKRMPETAVLAMCSEESPDKRKALFKEIQENGGVYEFPAPNAAACAGFVTERAKELGVKISLKTASELVSIAGCDYFTLENETAKLAAYCGYGEITSGDVRTCAAKSLEYNVFELHGLLMRGEAERARRLLEEILRMERPEGLIGLIARKFRDMLKARSMIDSGYPPSKIAALLGVSGYAADMITKDAKKFSSGELIGALKTLADVDYSMKSGEKDVDFALSEALILIYGLRRN